jgi:uncharacterized protein (DUF486 family)
MAPEKIEILRGIGTVGLLFVSNTFMTIAWYGHLRFGDKIRDSQVIGRLGVFSIVIVSWAVAFFEYCAQVPANRLGFRGNGGPFTMTQLKVIQEVITLIVFTVLSRILLGAGPLQWNHVAAFCCVIAAVFFVFLKA